MINNKKKILIIYGSLNSVPSPEGAAPAKIIEETISNVKSKMFKVLSNWNINLKGYVYDKNIFLHIKPLFIDKFFLFVLKMKFSYLERKKYFITGFDNKLLYYISVCRFLIFNRYKKIIVHVDVGLVLMLKRVFPKKKIIYYHHGTALHTHLSSFQWEKLIESVDAIFGVNLAALKYANETFAIQYPQEKYFGIHNAVTQLKGVNNTLKNKQCRIFSFLGRFCEEKGVFNLIKSFEIVSKNNHNVKLLIIGGAGTKNKTEIETSYIRKCKNYARDKKLNIVFTGYLKGYNMVKEFSKSDVMVLPTDKKLSQEGMPLSILEAFSIGIPVIATNVGGCPEVIEHMYNGFLIKKTSYIDELSSYMSLLVENVNLYKVMSQNAYTTYFQNYTYESYSNNFMTALRKKNFIIE